MEQPALMAVRLMSSGPVSWDLSTRSGQTGPIRSEAWFPGPGKFLPSLLATSSEMTPSRVYPASEAIQGSSLSTTHFL